MNKIEPTYVSFEQAKLLKEKGFDVPVVCLWFHNTTEPLDDEFYLQNVCLLNHNKYPDYISAPEQWQVISWLLQKYGLWIQVTMDKMGLFFPTIQTKSTKSYTPGYLHDNPKECYSEAIDYILKLII